VIEQLTIPASYLLNIIIRQLLIKNQLKINNCTVLYQHFLPQIHPSSMYMTHHSCFLYTWAEYDLSDTPEGSTVLLLTVLKGCNIRKVKPNSTTRCQQHTNLLLSAKRLSSCILSLRLTISS